MPERERNDIAMGHCQAEYWESLCLLGCGCVPWTLLTWLSLASRPPSSTYSPTPHTPESSRLSTCLAFLYRSLAPCVSLPFSESCFRTYLFLIKSTFKGHFLLSRRPVHGSHSWGWLPGQSLQAQGVRLEISLSH